jgi:hypothetical protein
MALILVVMFVGDHPRLFRNYRRQSMFLDSAITDHVALVAYLEQKLGARVHSASVQRLDLVNDTTLVDVRYSHPSVRQAVRNVQVATGGVPR